MAIDFSQAMAYIGASDTDTTEIMRCLNTANAMVGRVIAGAWRAVPEDVEDEAVLRTLYGLWAQRRTREDTSMLNPTATGGGYVANDPMRKAYDLLAPYLPRL